MTKCFVSNIRDMYMPYGGGGGGLLDIYFAGASANQHHLG